MDLDDATIKNLGAQRVYDAAFAWMSGDTKQADTLGLKISTLAEAYAIGKQAFGHMTAEEKAADYWNTQSALVEQEREADMDIDR